MWLKILTVLIVVTLLALIWWSAISGNIAYFDGETTFQIPSPLFTKGQKDELAIALRFPKDGVRDGIVLFMRTGANFQIVYVQDGKLIVNNNNNQFLVIDSDLERQDWIRFGYIIPDEFKDAPIYFGGAPIDQIPVNTLMFEGQSSIIQFPKSGLRACTNYCYLNNTNLSALFQQQGLRTHC